jgi:hypothetical protein
VRETLRDYCRSTRKEVTKIYGEYSDLQDEWQLERMNAAVERVDDWIKDRDTEQEAKDAAFAKYLKRLKRGRDV